MKQQPFTRCDGCGLGFQSYHDLNLHTVCSGWLRCNCYDAEAVGLASHGPDCFHTAECSKPAHSTCECV